MITSASTFETLPLLHDISLCSNSIATKQLGCTRTYVTERLIDYKLRKITKARIILPYAAVIQPFSKTVCSYLLFNCTGNAFGVFKTKENCYGLRSPTDYLTKVFALVSEKKEVAAEV